jgi:hypothetical protein
MNILHRNLVSKCSRVVKINNKINLENIKYELKTELLNDFNEKLLANNNIQSKNLIEFEKQLSNSIMKNVKDEINQRSEYIFNKKMNENNMKVINKNIEDSDIILINGLLIVGTITSMTLITCLMWPR